MNSVVFLQVVLVLDNILSLMCHLFSGEKPYVCTSEGCGKRFTEYSSLYKHHVVHTHTKPYECVDCGKTYRQISTLAMHRRLTHCDIPSAEPVSAAAAAEEVPSTLPFFLSAGDLWLTIFMYPTAFG